MTLIITGVASTASVASTGGEIDQDRGALCLNHRQTAFWDSAFRNARSFLRYNKIMSANNKEFAAPRARGANEHSRRAKVAPLAAAGLTVRAISAETGTPIGAVHRAKRQLEKTVAQGKQQAAAVSLNLPTSYVVKQDIGRVPQDVRRLTVAVYGAVRGERNRARAIGTRRPRRPVDCRQRLVRQHVRRPHDRVAQ